MKQDIVQASQPDARVARRMHVESLIVEGLAKRGWMTPLCETAIAHKAFDTAVGRKQAFVYFTGSDGYNFRVSGDYQSQGRNILSTSSVLIPVLATDLEIRAFATKFVNGVEKAVSSSYAVRLNS